MNKPSLRFFLACFFAQTCSFSSLWAQPPSTKVPFRDVPPAARETLLREAGKAVIHQFNKTQEEGEIVYEADVATTTGDDRTITVSADGLLLSREVLPREVPPAVRAEIRRIESENKIGQVYWCNEDGDIVYEVEVFQGERKRFFTVDVDGTLLAVEIAPQEAPEPVKKTLRAEVGNGELYYIGRCDEGGDVTFDAVYRRDNRRRTICLNPAGQVEAKQVHLDEMPEAARKTIKANLGGDRLAHIDCSVVEGMQLYEVGAVRNSVKRIFTVDHEGDLIGVEIPFQNAPAPVRQALEKSAASDHILRIEKILEEKEPVYEADIRKKGKHIILRVSESGKIL
ncbi:MAG: hypothetical protein NTX50_32410 [Candidatus Sumerlaeota bacterium]|nr:hypothetical protein [Candidatus Sumerlaeota bacterium]